MHDGPSKCLRLQKQHDSHASPRGSRRGSQRSLRPSYADFPEPDAGAAAGAPVFLDVEASARLTSSIATSSAASPTRRRVLTVLEPSRHVAEQLRDDRFAAQERERPAPRRQSAFLPERDHAVGKSPHLFRLRLGRLDALVIQQRRDKAPKQRPSVFGLAPELSSFFSVSHGGVSPWLEITPTLDSRWARPYRSSCRATAPFPKGFP
jgi:hypothetical protein